MVQPGDRFGSLEVASEPYHVKEKHSKGYLVNVQYVVARCDCGKTYGVRAYAIRRNKGCARCSALRGQAYKAKYYPAVDGMKKCYECKQVLPVDWFHRHKKKADGLATRCIDCARKDYLGTTYEITVEQYEALAEAQGHRCAICETPHAECRLNKGRWNIDHDHVTRVVRGLLCIPCNIALGWLGDDIGRLARAMGYLIGAASSPLGKTA